MFRVAHASEGESTLPTSAGGEEGKPRNFAVVELAGSQFKVTADDVLAVNRLPDVDIGQTVELDRVLLVGSGGETLIGRPYVPQAKVVAVCEQQTKEEKILAFYKKEKTNSQRSRGFRRQVTVLRIKEVIAGQVGEASGAPLAKETMR